jgi:high-affinity Fe2+/Pb2+ permease
MIGTAFIKRWPRAFCYAIIGLIAGALIGLFIGGVGVTMRGGAFRIYTELVLAIAVHSLATAWASKETGWPTK